MSERAQSARFGRIVLLPTALSLSIAGLSVPHLPAIADDDPAGRCGVNLLAGLQETSASSIRSGDPTGRWYVGTVSYFKDVADVLWHDGQATEVEIPGGDSYLSAVSSDGTALGVIRESEDVPFALVDGQIRRLGKHPRIRFGTTASTISNDGRIGGYAYGPDGLRARPLVWSLDDLAHPSAAYRIPRGFSAAQTFVLDDGRTIVQATDTSGSDDRAWWWSADLVRRPLDAPEIGEHVLVQAAAAGWAAGAVYDHSEPSREVRWNLDTGEAQEILPFSYGLEIVDVNASGVVAANSFDPDGPYLISDQAVVSLPPVDGAAEPKVVSISDSNIAAGSNEVEFFERAVTWSCYGRDLDGRDALPR